ncbi:hypothetical protein K7432_009262 [Basidiobolus ranarum]|uniref:Uncharacterized protein n=1 Tax=Basidiobolus ranarum TaxID=34480 RepID=A0ABR2WQH8_9FUNG
MNWTGGQKNSLRNKFEKQKQRDFFKKLRMKQNAIHSNPSSISNKFRSQSKPSIEGVASKLINHGKETTIDTISENSTPDFDYKHLRSIDLIGLQDSDIALPNQQKRKPRYYGCGDAEEPINVEEDLDTESSTSPKTLSPMSESYNTDARSEAQVFRAHEIPQESYKFARKESPPYSSPIITCNHETFGIGDKSYSSPLAYSPRHLSNKKIHKTPSISKSKIQENYMRESKWRNLVIPRSIAESQNYNAAVYKNGRKAGSPISVSAANATISSSLKGFDTLSSSRFSENRKKYTLVKRRLNHNNNDVELLVMKQRIQTLEVENTRSRLEIGFLKDELKDLSIKLNSLEAQNKEALLLHTHQVSKVRTDERLFTNGYCFLIARVIRTAIRTNHPGKVWLLRSLLLL